ncbi:hypothetical protein DL95DRAFT_417823 [Leptodontidium sp. 2 PMI_412]|nr:hypothetical protein DL95DRAFT_417823 [Leptodontidium sp. 2 PMI_412]
MSLLNIITALRVLLIASLTSATFLPQNRIVNGKQLGRARRQDLAALPSWTSPDFCYETGQIRDMASLMVHPPLSKTLDYSSLCSEVLRPTKIISISSILTGDSVVTVTSTATVSISTTTSEFSHSTTTALCSLPSPSQRCGIPALGFSQNILYFKTGLTGIECHELCLRDSECRSFQVVPQDNGFLKYNRCNIYRTQVDGYPGCAKKAQKQKRDREDSKCCRLERLPNVRPDKEMDGEGDDQLDSLDLDLGDKGLGLSVDDGIRVERDEISDVDVEEVFPLAEDEGIRVERAEIPDVVVEEILPVDVDEGIRVERDESSESTTEDTLPMDLDEGIRVERGEAPETPEEAARNGYKLPILLLNNDDDEEVRPMKRKGVDFPSRTVPRSTKWYKLPVSEAEEEIQPLPDKAVAGPGKRNSPPRPARTPSPRIPSWYKIPLPERDETYKLPIEEGEDTYRLPAPEPELEPEQDNETIRVEKRDDGQADPMITPAPALPILGGGNELSGLDHDRNQDLGLDKGIRVEKRAIWTTPDFLTTFFPLFITLACSCLVGSAAPVVTSSVTEVVQTWNYTTDKSNGQGLD